MKENEGNRKFVELEWVCPNCDGVNKGSQKTCQSCGAPQPDNVKFRRAADEQILVDEKKIAAAGAGADIHCGFCGTRNPGNAATCSQCGADLKEGKARASGQVLQASAAPKTLACSNCGMENSSSDRICKKCGAPLARAAQKQPVAAASQTSEPSAAAPKKVNWLLIGGIAAALLLCCAVVFGMFVMPSKTVQGTVTGVEWKTYVPVEELGPVKHTRQTGSVPSKAYNVSCQTENEEICEEKTVDQGNGYAEVVRECRTDNTEYCDYTVDEWKEVQTYTLSGADNFPVYDNPPVQSDQRLGSAREDLTVYFSIPDGQESYTPASVAEFQNFTVGSEWKLTMNALGGVLSAER